MSSELNSKNSYENECFKIYDVEEPDINKKLIAVEDRLIDVEKKSGITIRRLRSCLVHKTRMFSPSLNKTITIRLGNKNEKRRFDTANKQILSSKLS
jgi:hypothetical protein